MKHIGVLFGSENTFPFALIDKINEITGGDTSALPVSIGKVSIDEIANYDLIIDLISVDIPFYQSYLKSTALAGINIINSPFSIYENGKFFLLSLAKQFNIKTPKTMLMPSKVRARKSNEHSYRNLKFPMEWEEMFMQVGFPAYLKPNSTEHGGHVYHVHSMEELWEKHENTGELLMILQQEIRYQEYVRVYGVGQKHFRIMPIKPSHPPHLRYATSIKEETFDSAPWVKSILKSAQHLAIAADLSFCSFDFAIQDGVPYLIDAYTPSPVTDAYLLGTENFEWLVNNMANYAVEILKKSSTDRNLHLLLPKEPKTSSVRNNK